MFRFVTSAWLIAVACTLAQAGPARIGGDPARDMRQTLHARKLLADDPDLAMWNIGVSVRDRVATLWGPVPSAEVAFRAELCLKSMIELMEVRNELFVSDLVRPMRAPLKIDNTPKIIPSELPPVFPRVPRLFEPIPERSTSSHATPIWPALKRLPATIRFD
jgi:hypothetical protein